MKTKIFLLVLFLLATKVADAQIMFQRHYGGVADDYGSRVLQMDDGGYIVASITESFGAGYRDIYLIRTDEYGDVTWTKTYGGTGYEQPNAMKKTNDGNIIIAGETSSFGAGNSDCYLIKINQDGDTLWTRTYGGADEDGACDVIQTSDNGLILVGYSSSYTTVFCSLYIVKTNSDGDTIWTKTYEKSFANIASSICQLTEMAILLLGRHYYQGNSKHLIAILSEQTIKVIRCGQKHTVEIAMMAHFSVMIKEMG